MTMDAKDFYDLTEKTLINLANTKGIDEKELARYYELTDYDEQSVLMSDYFQKNPMAQLFAQIALHGQNATMLSSIVKFDDNIEFLKDKLCGFDPKEFLKEYPANDRDNSILRIINTLRYDENTNQGLKWDSSKSKEGNKDKLIRRFANTLMDAAIFLSKFESKEAFKDNLIKEYHNKNSEQVINYFKSNFSQGFSIALTCDFLKEFDKAFSDLPKPDVHIQDTLCALNSKKKGYYNSSDKRQFKCIKEMQNLTKEINDNLDENKKITVYKLDKMIWLICSGSFYLHDRGNIKQSYLNQISGTK